MIRRDQFPEMVILLARIAVRAYDYVGGDELPPQMDADRQMQKLATEAFRLVGGQKNAREIAKNNDTANTDGRTRKRRLK